jgi:hexosaminidase
MLLAPAPRKLQQSPGTTKTQTPPTISIEHATGHPQGYVLSISPQAIDIRADDSAGVFYAQQTLTQLRRQFPQEISCLKIEDWPDFPARGVMLDISRDKVPTMSTLFALVDQLAELKINQLQLYTEHTFAYREHEIAWKNASPMTAAEIRQLDAYCRQRFIELVPNQNSFGHLERWFERPEYRQLAEAPDGFVFPTGRRMKNGFSLNPLDPRSIAFVEQLYDELLPNFSSGLFNVGCDETFDIGLGHSKDEVNRRGRERVYLDFLLKIHRAVEKRGRKMMFWGDIILNRPELLNELPRDIIAMNWGYEADHPFETEARAFRDAQIPFYVCPGTSSWCSITGRSDNAIANLKNAAKQGLQYGAIGYLITDWGDYGHLQYLPISFLGFAAGAAYSWCYQTNHELPVADVLNEHIFRDSAKVMGQLMLELGNVHHAMKKPLANETALFWRLIDTGERKKLYENVTPEEYADARERIDRAIAPLTRARIARPDANLIRDEILNAAAMLKHACDLGQLRDTSHSQIVSEHRRLWSARNRPGGSDHSISVLQHTAD